MDFPVFPRKKYSGWQKPSAARHSAEIFVPEGHIFHCKALPAQIVQVPRVRGQVKGQLVGIQGLPRLAVAAVYVPTAVFAVPQQRAVQIRHRGADLVGPARHRDAGREAQAVFGFQYGIFRPAGFAIGGDAPPDDTLPLPPDGGVDDAFTEGQFALHDGIVELFDVPGQQRSGVAILCGQHIPVILFLHTSWR